MLYKIRPNEDIFELNDGLRAVPQYAALTSRQMTYVCLVCDPSKDNPVRTLFGKHRRERAAEIAGWPKEEDGKRLDKNGRMAVMGKVPSIEAAIEEFKKNHFNSNQHSIDALKAQIAEIREFLSSDKKIPLVDRGKVVMEGEGEMKKRIMITDQKALKLAVELGEKLPTLEEALEKLESAAQDEPEFEALTYTTADLDTEDVRSGTGSLLDQHNEALKRNEKRD